MATILLLLVFVCSSVSAENFKITPIESNPGLYYEFGGTLQLEEAEWKIRIALRCPDLSEIFPQDELEKIFDICIDRTKSRCANLIPVDRLRHKMNRLDLERKDLLSIFTYQKVTSMMKTSNGRPTRGAPLEGVGWLQKKIFGVMDAGDREEITGHMQELFERQRNISALVAGQTIIVRSDLNDVHEVLNNHTISIKMLRKEFQEGLKNSRDQMDVNLNISYWAARYEESLDAVTTIFRGMAEAIEHTSRGHLHPLLLSHKQLKEVLRKINDPEKEQRVGYSNVTLDYLFSSSKTTLHVLDGTFIVTLNVPIPGKQIFNIFKLHSLYVNTTQIAGVDGYIYIKPSNEYIMIDVDEKSYFLAPSSYLTLCTQAYGGTICPPDYPIDHENDKAACEYLLYRNPKPASLNNCDYNLSPGLSYKWTKLITTDEWLYSSANESTVTLSCPKNAKTVVKIQGNGIFSFSGNCTAHTLSQTLSGVSRVLITETFAYQPEVLFDLEVVRPKLHDLLITNEPEAVDHQELRSWIEGHNSVALGDIEHKLIDIAKKRSFNKILQYQTAVGMSINLSALILVFFILLYRRRISQCLGRLKTKDSKRKPRHSTSKSIDETPEEGDDGVEPNITTEEIECRLPIQGAASP